jgi:PBP1b-binding outer membrane lipoprotein LpoB
MTNIKSNLTAIIIASVFLTSCSNSSSTDYSSSPSNETSNSTTPSYTTPERTSSSNEKDPYEMMQVAFEGSPEISKIKPMLEAVLEKYDLPKTDEYRLKVGSMLVSLRKASAVGVTEMEILKHIYQNGSNKISLPDQAGLSATLLETSK